MMDEPECDSCHSTGVKLTTYPVETYSPLFKNQGKTEKQLCHLCANTIAGNAYEWKTYSPPVHDLAPLICFIGNEILKALRGDVRSDV